MSIYKSAQASFFLATGILQLWKEIFDAQSREKRHKTSRNNTLIFTPFYHAIAQVAVDNGYKQTRVTFQKDLWNWKLSKSWEILALLSVKLPLQTSMSFTVHIFLLKKIKSVIWTFH